jgi:Holliday junction DNA helicase RuvA
MALQSNAQADALSALQNLGYSPSEAAAAVAQVMVDAPEPETSGVIRAALKLLAPKG